MIFLQSWNPFSNSFIKTESTAAYSSLFRGLCLANIPKCIQLFAITAVSTAQRYPSCALVSVDTDGWMLLSGGSVPGATLWWRAATFIVWGRGWAALPYILGSMWPTGCGLDMHALVSAFLRHRLKEELIWSSSLNSILRVHWYIPFVLPFLTILL